MRGINGIRKFWSDRRGGAIERIAVLAGALALASMGGAHFLDVASRNPELGLYAWFGRSRRSTTRRPPASRSRRARSRSIHAPASRNKVTLSRSRGATWTKLPSSCRSCVNSPNTKKLSHEVDATEAMIADALFGPRHRSSAISPSGKATVGFALWFNTFSSFRGRRGVWLEDFRAPAHRGRGIGQALLKRLARRCVEGLDAVQMVGARLECAVDFLYRAGRGTDGRLDDLSRQRRRLGKTRRLEEIRKRGIDAPRLLQRRDMPAIRNDHEFRALDPPAISRAFSGGVSWSCAPVSTSVGQAISARPGAVRAI